MLEQGRQLDVLARLSLHATEIKIIILVYRSV